MEKGEQGGGNSQTEREENASQGQEKKNPLSNLISEQCIVKKEGNVLLEPKSERKLVHGNQASENANKMKRNKWIMKTHRNSRRKTGKS